MRGCFPGPVGGIVKLEDGRGVTSFKNDHIRLPWPSFMPEPGVQYAKEINHTPQDYDPFAYNEAPFKQWTDDS